MPWTEVSPGRFERPFDHLERHYLKILSTGIPLNREHYSISGAIRLEWDRPKKQIIDALRSAWKTLRFDYPSLAAVPLDDKCVYEIPNEAALEAWLKETVVVLSSDSETTVDDLYANFTPGNLAKIYYFPRSCEVVIHSSHWRIDGIGLLYLFDKLLKLLDEPREVQFGNEAERLSISLDEVMGLKNEVKPELEQAATAQLMKILTNFPPVGLPTKPEKVPGSSQRCRLELEPDLTSAIISNSKSKGYSVTTIIHAAIICANQVHADHDIPAKTYTSLLAYDLRKYCPAPYNTTNYPLCVYHTGFPATVVPSTLFENASQLKSMYSQPLTEWNPSPFDYLTSYVKQASALILAPLPEGTPIPSEVNLSSLGLLNGLLSAKYGKDIEVKDFWLGVEMLTRVIMIHVWTREGRLTFSACYNREFYDASFVKTVLETVKQELVKGLGIHES
ncbi:hypothetical protein MMC25_001573 [Agyrium rufum]|nr:hypothetical protein [Agyrium rufum]